MAVLSVYVCVSLCDDVVQSSGWFIVNVTANGTTTLQDIQTCAIQLIPYIRDPANWIKDKDIPYHFTKFLRNDHPELFSNLSGCADQYISTSDHMLAVCGSGWLCPTLVTSTDSGAVQTLMSASISLVVVVALSSWLVQLLTAARR